ncbi:MAG: acetylornithine/succinylornithine family transaminase [Clostridia bacterium]|nr:acetylornithine/succinylornithine family transaminase [Clostridia bacterium]
MSLRDLDSLYIAPTYKRFSVALVRGEGSLVWDEDGKEYIDLGTGIAVNTFGYSDAVWAEAVTSQLHTLQHTSNLYTSGPCALLAERLCTLTGMKKVFFSNSGAEANECAIKVARKWAAEHNGPEYSTIVTLKNSFHGRTLTTLAATGQDHFHELFQPLTPGFVHVAAGDVGELEKAFAENKVAGILIECVQGEGGVMPLDPDYALQVERIARRENALLMVDEVQTGNGRTGELYAYMGYGLHPDVVSTAKGLAGGLPLGATLLGERAEHVFGYGDHGSTFGGNPVCCAAALSVLGRLDGPLLAGVRAKSDWIREALTGVPGVKGVSGLGLMLGIATEKPAGEIAARCLEKGVLVLTAKDKVRLLPALNIPDELLHRAVGILKDVIAE